MVDGGCGDGRPTVTPMARTTGSRLAIWSGVLVVAATLGAACSSDDASGPTPTSSPTEVDVTEAPERDSDGVLTIGVLLPRSGPGGALGEPLIDVIQATVRAINSEGGVLDQPIGLVLRDEGTDRTGAELAIGELLEEGVDAIIGPGSSNIAVAVAPSIVNSGVMACSPLATSLLLTDLPDDGLLLRTVPGDDLQAEAIARTIDGTGFREVSLVIPDDIYGRTFGVAVRDAIEARGLDVLSEVPYSATAGDFRDVALDVVADQPPVIALIGTSDNGVRLVSAIEETSPEGTSPLIVASDTMRDADVTPLITAGSDVLTLLSGVSLQPFGGAIDIRTLLGLATDQPTPAFAAAAVDCVNLIALTARQVGRDDPNAMAALVQSTTSGGTGCVSYATCGTLLAQGRDISYDGPTGLLSIDEQGDPTVGEFLAFAFDGDGRDVTTGRFIVGTD